MMRKIALFIILSMIMPLLISCGAERESSLTERSEEVPVPEENWPVLTGTFMQPGHFSQYTQPQMDAHFSDLLEVGIDMVILQWTMTNSSDGIGEVYFEAEIPDNAKNPSYSETGSGLLEKLLESAKKHKMKIVVGLNNNNEFWTYGVSDIDWIKSETKIGIECAEQIYAKYSGSYSEELYGWYFTPEYWNMKGYEPYVDNAAYYLSAHRDALADIDVSMPMLLSPFVSASQLSPDETEKMWTQVFAKATLRQGDIFCCQDSVGAGHIGIEQMESYFASMKRAVDTKEGLVFWANNEDFTVGSGTAPLERFLEQMMISSKYCSGHVTFAYSHYQSPDQGKRGHHEAYKYYYENGKIPEETVLSSPEVDITYSETKREAEVRITVDNSSGHAFEAVITRNGSEIKRKHFEQDIDEKSIEYTYIDDLIHVGGEMQYGIYLIDYYSNETETVTKTIQVMGEGLHNVALGKPYTTTNCSDSYPDENGISLTDGKTGSASFASPEWNGYVGNGSVTIDLEEKKVISKIAINVLCEKVAGIYPPSSVNVSFDGSDESIGTLIDWADFTETTTTVVTVSLEQKTPARYVTIEVSGREWIFIDEIMVYAEE